MSDALQTPTVPASSQYHGRARSLSNGSSERSTQSAGQPPKSVNGFGNALIANRVEKRKCEGWEPNANV
ncbi:hypothetical protein MMC22_006064 [Lobaria immixta]|nr:hypothetical protein [Lobaria immixta]